MLPGKVLITAKVHPYIQQRLEQLGYVVDVSENISREKLLACISDYCMVVITTYTKIDAEVVGRAEKLRIVARVGSGMENVDVACCRSGNIICLNSPEGNGNAVGEHALAMLLNRLNNITKANNELKNNLFLREENRGEELDGKTVGIIGYGHTGRSFAKKLRGFEVKILVFDPYIKTADDFVQQVTLQTIQKECDVISFHVPYNKETHHYCNAAFLEACVRHPVIINTARGAVLNTTDIISALEQHQIRGLCIDVYEDEPLTKNAVHPHAVYQRLLSFSNVVATPHIAGWTVESNYKLARILMDKVEDALRQLSL